MHMAKNSPPHGRKHKAAKDKRASGLRWAVLALLLIYAAYWVVGRGWRLSDLLRFLGAILPPQWLR